MSLPNSLKRLLCHDPVIPEYRTLQEGPNSIKHLQIVTIYIYICPWILKWLVLMQVIGQRDQIRAETCGHCTGGALDLELPLLRQELHSGVLCLAQLVPLLPRWRFDVSRLQIRCKSRSGRVMQSLQIVEQSRLACLPLGSAPVWTGRAPSCQIRTLSHAQFHIKRPFTERAV